LMLNFLITFMNRDLSFWQYADKGFFKLKKKIKNIVSPFWNTPLFGAP